MKMMGWGGGVKKKDGAGEMIRRLPECRLMDEGGLWPSSVPLLLC